MTSELSIARLEASLDAKIERYFDTLDTEPDVLKHLLADKRSENTRRAYERDVNDFLKALLNTGMNSRFPNCYKPSMVSFVTSSEKLIHTVNQQRRLKLVSKNSYHNERKLSSPSNE